MQLVVLSGVYLLCTVEFVFATSAVQVLQKSNFRAVLVCLQPVIDIVGSVAVNLNPLHTNFICGFL